MKIVRENECSDNSVDEQLTPNEPDYNNRGPWQNF